MVIDKGEAFTEFVFFRKDSRRAGDALLADLRARGEITEKGMGEFVRKLVAGELGFKFSKVNFYDNVLGRLMNLGFIGKFDGYDGKTRKTVRVYRAVTQPIPTRRPDNPSFWYVTYEICKWWNELMFSKATTPDQKGEAAA